MFEQLKNLNLERIDIDEAVGMLTLAESMAVKYDELEVARPEWLNPKIKLLTREIRERNHDALAAKLSRARAAFEAMKPAETKRAELAKEIKRLETQVGA